MPSIAGLWNVQVGKSSKGEAAWQLIVRQSGAEVSAAILRIDGDTGTLTGTYRDGKFALSHFSGARPLRLELTPAADGTLAVVQNKDKPLTAMRAEQADGERTAAAERSDALHQREGSDRAVPFQLSRSRRQDRVEHRPALPGQGRDRRHRRQLVPELPRRNAVPRRALQEIPRSRGSRSSSSRSRKRRR